MPKISGCEAQLRLEVIGAAGRLPDVLGLRVALVPHLAEQGPERHLRVAIVDAPLDQASLPVRRQDGVALGRNDH